MPAYFDTGFSVRQPMWHGGGLILDEYPTDWADAREKAGLLWEPTTRPAYSFATSAACATCGAAIGTQHREGCCKHNVVLEDESPLALVDPRDIDPQALVDAIQPVPDHQLVVRDDTEAVLGVVGDQFALVNHADMGGILEAVLGLDNVKFETAGSVRGGAQVWALAYVDEPFTVAGDNTETYPFLALLNAHDGSGACKLIDTEVRIVCWNTYRAAEMEGERTGRVFSFRHVGDVHSRIEEAKQALAGVREHAHEWDALATELFGLKADDAAFQRFVQDFIPEPAAEIVSDRVRANVDAARKAFKTIYLDSVTTAAHHGTALGLVDASVEYLDHVRGYRSRDSLMGRTLLRAEPLKARATALAREVCNA